MKTIQFSKTKNKIIVLVVAVLLLLAASQWWTIKMIYAQKLKGDTALFFAKAYRLTAGRAVGPNEQLTIYLSDLLQDQVFAQDYIKKESAAEKNPVNFSDQDIKDMVWKKVLKQAWIDHLAKKDKITLQDQDLEDFYKGVGGLDTLKDGLKSANINFEQYQNFVVKPSVMEAKVYKSLLDNFNDLAGMQKAQNAYKALVDDKKPFADVAAEFSDDKTYIDSSMFVRDDELGEFGEPIKNLKPGEYSKIMVMPGNPGYYVIWLLKGVAPDPETKQEVKELRGIAVQAKSMDEFYQEWQNSVKISQWYK